MKYDQLLAERVAFLSTESGKKMIEDVHKEKQVLLEAKKEHDENPDPDLYENEKMRHARRVIMIQIDLIDRILQHLDVPSLKNRMKIEEKSDNSEMQLY